MPLLIFVGSSSKGGGGGIKFSRRHLVSQFSFVLPFLQLHRILKGKTLLGKDWIQFFKINQKCDEWIYLLSNGPFDRKMWRVKTVLLNKSTLSVCKLLCKKLKSYDYDDNFFNIFIPVFLATFNIFASSNFSSPEPLTK